MPDRAFVQMSDEDLARWIGRGNEQAFAQLFDRHWLTLLDKGMKILKNKEAAQDCVQEVFLDVWRKRESWQVDHVVAYLSQAIKYKVIDHIRKTRIPISDLDHVDHVLADRNTEVFLDYQELHQLLDQSVSELPLQCQRVFRMSRFDHLSNKEIAIRLNLSVRTVENHIANAVKSLRLRLEHVSPMALILLLY